MDSNILSSLTVENQQCRQRMEQASNPFESSLKEGDFSAVFQRNDTDLTTKLMSDVHTRYGSIAEGHGQFGLYTRDDLERLKELDLGTFRDIIDRTINYLDSQNAEDIIVALGNTGCGKSTLLHALLHGSESLGLQNIEK